VPQACLHAMDEVRPAAAARRAGGATAHIRMNAAATIGGHAQLLRDGRMRLTGLVARTDGSFVLKRHLDCLQADAERAGLALGDELRADSPRDIFA